jgi:nicotinamide mononucleotide transporter
MRLVQYLFGVQLTVFGHPILWREVFGNLFGFASAVGGMRRRVWAWPVGIAGNILLFTVFFGVAFANPQHTTLLGQAARQVFFILTSVYGWYRWAHAKRSNADRLEAIVPRWARTHERLAAAAFWLVGVAVAQQLIATMGVGFVAPRWYYWCDSWIFVGSVVATYAMARGWNDFWLAWIAVDAVGVPLLIHSGFYPSAALYVVYAMLVLYGFVVWARASSRSVDPVPADHLEPVAK